MVMDSVKIADYNRRVGSKPFSLGHISVTGGVYERECVPSGAD